MKVKKQYKFIPVIITLETEEEVNLFWDAIENVMNDNALFTKQKELLIDISNEFTNLNVV